MMAVDKPYPITPDTKVGELLDNYPDLENELFELSPAFRKLQNPILRRTVAKVTSLRHAAKVGGVSLGELINKLRVVAGQQEAFQDDSEIVDGSAAKAPSWLTVDRIVRRIDVRPILDAGEKPVGKVMGELAKIPEGKICELTAPFQPAPLIDMAVERGFEAWSKEESANLVVKVFLYRKPTENGEDADELISLE